MIFISTQYKFNICTMYRTILCKLSRIELNFYKSGVLAAEKPYFIFVSLTALEICLYCQKSQK